MPTPVIADVFEVVLDWTASNITRHAKNVLHFLGEGSTVEDVSAAIEDSWGVEMWQPVSSTASIGEYTIRPMDGTSPATPFTPGTPAAVQGQSGGQVIPQVCALVKATTPHGGRSGRGRVYLPFIGEDAQDKGVIPTSPRDTCTGGWVGFTNAMVDAEIPMVIASIADLAAYQVTNVACEPTTATQRRRLRRS